MDFRARTFIIAHTEYQKRHDMFGYILSAMCGRPLCAMKIGSVCLTSVVIRITTYIYAAVMISSSTSVIYVRTNIVYVYNSEKVIRQVLDELWNFCKVSKEFSNSQLLIIWVMGDYGV